MLSRYSPNIPGKYCFLDQGGDLAKSHEIQRILKQYQYDIRITGTDNSQQNGPVEREHLTIANSIRAQLIGGGMHIKFWPYAFHHSMRIRNSLPPIDMNESPNEKAGFEKDNFTNFHSFGTRAWIHTKTHCAKFCTASKKGRFLGFLPNTTKTLYGGTKAAIK